MPYLSGGQRAAAHQNSNRVLFRGGTQLWVGYGCAARSLDHHPIKKPEKTQICYLYQNHLFLEGPLFKTNQCFLQYKLGSISTFWQPIDKPKDKFIGNYAFCKNATYIKTSFQIKKGPLQNLRARKSTLSGPHIPVPTFPLSTPPPGVLLNLHFRDPIGISFPICLSYWNSNWVPNLYLALIRQRNSWWIQCNESGGVCL